MLVTSTNLNSPHIFETCIDKVKTILTD